MIRRFKKEITRKDMSLALNAVRIKDKKPIYLIHPRNLFETLYYSVTLWDITEDGKTINEECAAIRWSDDGIRFSDMFISYRHTEEFIKKQIVNFLNDAVDVEYFKNVPYPEYIVLHKPEMAVLNAKDKDKKQ